MRFDVVTIFPEMFKMLGVSKIWQRAQAGQLMETHIHDLRDYTQDVHRTVDDVPYGGGPGMVLKLEPLVKAVESIPPVGQRKVLYPSPQGKPLTQAWVEELAQLNQIVVVSGRYEGVDERFVEGWVDDSFSVGDFVLSGGELPAMALLDAVARVLPGVVGDEDSVKLDSFSSGGLKYPQYTRPAEFRGRKVPPVLLSGNHRDIETWRSAASRQRTRERRPDLLGSKVAEVGEIGKGLTR